ncbi:GH92 family glycosyl hydrolase [uncultured Duncaniella sp.]|uniref:GH92 family glycosyl hydrolase n=1 Tax=uncultured Duncaniella sp. TaxID=2768039 RepID=UPI00266EA116|nr:GH92 family glycosyl hydrolase [uncultured Duncaniella sp.]
MKTTIITLITVGALVTACSPGSVNNSHDADPARYVNPFIGTDFTGNTYPGAQVPFGMVQLSPDNGLPGWDRISGYFYPDSTIAGFSHTHLSGTGAGDLYDISFLPVTHPHMVADDPLGVYSRFSHDSEEATAGYYKVTLSDYDIDVELTATERVGVQRYRFPEGRETSVRLNLAKAMNWDATIATDIRLIDSTTIAGYRYSTGWARDQKVYFCTRFSRPYTEMSVDTVSIPDSENVGLIATFDFDNSESHELVVVTAISGTGIEGARANLAAEAPHNDFDIYRKQARDMWNSELSKINVESDDEDRLTVFYTALYHSMLAPTLYCDTDGKYRGADGSNHDADGWKNYSTFSTWDTYRAAHPLYTITDTARVSDMVNSFLAFHDQHGRLPVWNMWGSETDMMIGYHTAAIIADAYLKGIGGFDADKALDACVKTANTDSYRGIGEYKRLGYVPYDLADAENSDNWSLSKTLEYAFDDYAIAMMAKGMGRTDVYNDFMSRAGNYRNVFNPATGFMQPRAADGNFVKDFDAADYTPHICESNAWQYLWSVQHEPDSLMGLIGGKKAFEAKLDTMFTYTPSADEELPIFSTGMVGQYAHGNEPSHHVAYLYNLTDNPGKGQKLLSKIMTEQYSNTPEGLPGNEDCGQMSAWYVFSAMGFYPVNPVGGVYEIGTPFFPRVEISVGNNKKFTLIANNLTKDCIFVKSVKVDGKPYHKSHITHRQILDGATVELEMASTPQSPWYE